MRAWVNGGDTAQSTDERQEKLDPAPFLALTGCKSSGKSLNLSEPSFLDL